MTRKETNEVPWTEDEDFYMTEGYSMYHDDRLNTTDFMRMREFFPFKNRSIQDLTDHWREMNDQLESEEQEVMDHIKNGTKYHTQTWQYKSEPTFDGPDLNKMLDDYREMPSLSMKTQSIEVQSSKYANDNQNINEFCLNHQFDAANINRIVSSVLLKTVDDETLRTTLLHDFHKIIMAHGREYALEDFTRRLEYIANMQDQVAIDYEINILNLTFERIFTNIKTRGQYSNTNIVKDCLNILISLNEKIQWPLFTTPPIEKLHHEFTQQLLQAFAFIFNVHFLNEQWYTFFKDYIDYVTKIDTRGDINGHLDQRLKNIFSQKHQAMHK